MKTSSSYFFGRINLIEGYNYGWSKIDISTYDGQHLVSLAIPCKCKMRAVDPEKISGLKISDEITSKRQLL